MTLNKFKIFISSIIILTFVSTAAKSTEECFENVSRSVFKFNMVVDELILEPIAKVITNFQSP